MCSIAVSADNAYVMTGSWDKSAKVWHAANGTEHRRFPNGGQLGFDEAVREVDFSADGSYVVTRAVFVTLRL